MVMFTPKFTCELLKWDVRLFVCLDRLKSKYHQDGFLDPLTTRAFNIVEQFLLDLRRLCNFEDAMSRYWKRKCQYMNGETSQEFRMSCIMDDTLKMAFPSGAPSFHGAFSHTEPWHTFTLEYSTLDNLHAALDYHCKGKDDAFDQLLACCLGMPEDDPHRQWIVVRLVWGCRLLTDEFYKWALPMLPEHMVNAYNTAKAADARKRLFQSMDPLEFTPIPVPRLSVIKHQPQLQDAL